MKMTDVHRQFPMPWRYVTQANGNIVVLDSANKIVPLLLLLDALALFTNSYARSAQPAEAPAESL